MVGELMVQASVVPVVRVINVVSLAFSNSVFPLVLPEAKTLPVENVMLPAEVTALELKDIVGEAPLGTIVKTSRKESAAVSSARR